MKRQYLVIGAAITISLFIYAACTDPGTGGPSKRDGGADECGSMVGLQGRDKVDVLFMVDSSTVGETVQNELRVRFPEFVKALADADKNGFPVDLHIGVVTSDYGAGATGSPGCQPSPGGDLGALVSVGRSAPMACKPPTGAPFIKYAFTPDGVTSNLPAGQDLALTFACMSAVGSSGCGFEHPLESVHAALNNTTQNAGFLRPDAALAVVFVTNEDDCSAPPDTDLFATNKVSMYGYSSSYRCSRFGIACGGQLLLYAASNGPLMSCAPATPKQGSPLYPIQRYIDLFTKTTGLGGAKDDPANVIVAGILPPASPVEVILSNPGTAGGAPYPTCSPLNEASNPPCVPVVQHSCQHKTEPIFFGDPPVRLDAVIRAAPSHELASLCDADFSDLLRRLARRITGRRLAGCLLKPVALDANPKCTVEEIAPGTGARTPVPACMVGGERPCWRLDFSSDCAELSPDGTQLVVERVAPAPPGTQLSATCRTACPKPDEK